MTRIDRGRDWSEVESDASRTGCDASPTELNTTNAQPTRTDVYQWKLSNNNAEPLRGQRDTNVTNPKQAQSQCEALQNQQNTYNLC